MRVGYIQEAPIWKTSYRLVLSDDAPPFLQGWAIVENTTESDWNDVSLTLVSGRPISFVMDLYQPLYVDRPEVQAGAVRLAAAADLRPGPGAEGRASSASRLSGWRQQHGGWPNAQPAGTRLGREPPDGGGAGMGGMGRRHGGLCRRPSARILRSPRSEASSNLQLGVQSVAQASERRRAVPLSHRHAGQAGPRQIGHAADRQRIGEGREGLDLQRSRRTPSIRSTACGSRTRPTCT